MRDVNNGWLIRYIHSNTASAFFFIVYLHIGRGLYYGSYQNPRTLVWSIGVVIFILMMAIKKWPNWILVNLIYKGGTRCLSLLAFNRARTRAILRVGPHSEEVLSIIICGNRNYTVTGKKDKTESGQLNPQFVTGFSDGEAYFSIRKTNRSTGWAVSPEFGIHLHTRDLPLLHKIQGEAFFSPTPLLAALILSARKSRVPPLRGQGRWVINYFDTHPA